ncbi:Eco57I restriction-modification methylase domain-containing protein [Halobacillus sp. H74]|uniref:Eco57I restriction-modification methylase domain-containing protein n=1 Tax=Halobacillus sp. H74 TaxID=3457436 RepID=UPI003FCCA19E
MISQKRMMGQYGTPQETVNHMVHTLLSYLPASIERPKILDPSTGDGIFTLTLIAEGIDPGLLYAYDIDPTVSTPHSDVNFMTTDFLKADVYEEFDAIIGNPPYKSKRQSEYFLENNEFIKKQFGSIGVHNLYSLFIHKGIQALKPGGILTMIVQDSFLTNVYYKNFRHYLLSQTQIKEIALAPRRLFHKGKADVRTAILILKKKEAGEDENGSLMKLVDRLDNQFYETPLTKNVQYLNQKHFESLPGYNFAINVPFEILQHFQMPYQKFGDVIEGGTGISTGNDRHFLRKYEQIDNFKEWIPFYKNGGVNDGWYYAPKYYIHKDWQIQQEGHPNFTIRNSAFFYRKGITCSSMGVGFSAAYLPKNSLFGVNANFFPENEDDLFYFLGLLNSKLATYMVRKVLNRTNMITSGYIKKLPYAAPSSINKEIVRAASRSLVKEKKLNPHFNTGPLQRTIDEAIYDIYGISKENQGHVEEFCQDILERI